MVLTTDPPRYPAFRCPARGTGRGWGAAGETTTPTTAVRRTTTTTTTVAATTPTAVGAQNTPTTTVYGTGTLVGVARAGAYLTGETLTVTLETAACPSVAQGTPRPQVRGREIVRGRTWAPPTRAGLSAFQLQSLEYLSLRCVIIFKRSKDSHQQDKKQSMKDLVSFSSYNFNSIRFRADNIVKPEFTS